MSLDTDQLGVKLFELFSAPPEGFNACADAWAEAIEVYSEDIEPSSTTVSAAVVTLSTALSAAFQAGAATGSAATTAAQLETAFANFAVTVGTGMAPANVATPPPGLVGWAVALAETPPSTHQAASDKYTSLIDDWMKTGSSVPSGGGPSSFWS